MQIELDISNGKHVLRELPNDITAYSTVYLVCTDVPGMYSLTLKVQTITSRPIKVHTRFIVYFIYAHTMLVSTGTL